MEPGQSEWLQGMMMKTITAMGESFGERVLATENRIEQISAEEGH